MATVDKTNLATNRVERLPIAVLRDGPGTLFVHCLKQSTPWDVVEIAPDAVQAAEFPYAMVLVSSTQAQLMQPPALDGPPIVIVRRGLEDPRTAGYDSNTVADPVEISLKRLLGEWLGEGLDCLSIVEWRPGEKPLGRNGPLDSVRIEEIHALRIDHGKEIPLVHQLFIAPHTRSRIVTCVAQGSGCPSIEQLLERAASNPDVFVAPHADGFRDTAVLSEYFRDLGRGLGFFYETALFDRTVHGWPGGINFTFACSEVAIFPEVLQRISLIADNFTCRTSDVGAAQNLYLVSG